MLATSEETVILNVTVAVLSYRRAAQLGQLLPALSAQATASRDDVSVLVVDNDPDQSAREVVRRSANGSVRYVLEPIAGIAAARNRALDEASGSDVIVFIDDDESPVDGWLDAMLDLFRRERPAAVVGPVVSVFDGRPDTWISEGGFFERPRFPTGASVKVAATNNLLLDVSRVNAIGLRFDHDFGLTGGSDTLFTASLVADGARMIWCDEALVFDHVPKTRMTREWVLKRYYRSGNSKSRAQIQLAATPVRRLGARVMLSAAGAARVGHGVLRWLFGGILGSVRHQARGQRTLHRGLGMLSGAWGHIYFEYGRG